ncbi:MAG: HAD-IA family hydrolase [Actinomycetota bacterium]
MSTELDTVADDWQLAFDQAQRALDAAGKSFSPEELHERRRRLAQERADTARELVALARDAGVHETPWIAPWAVTPALLGLPDTVRACIFDLDGVLTDSHVMQAAAWAEALDPLLLEMSEHPGRHFIPFDRDAEYSVYLDGRPRLEGLQLFLAGRGIRVEMDEALAIARRKSEIVGRALHHRGLNARAGARRYLESAGHAGLGRAVVSSSTRTLPMLELADLATLVDARVDADQITNGSLHSRPAPDLLLRACELLEVEPHEAVSFTHIPDGVAAARAAGMQSIGVAMGEAGRERLRVHGAELVVPCLADLLAPRLAAALAA